MKMFLETLGAQLLPTLTTAIGAMICALLAYATAYLKSKTKNADVQAALDRFDQVSESAVKDAQQSVIEAAEKKDGKTPDEVFTAAKAAALASIKSHYGEKGLSELKKIFGWDDIDKNLSSMVEAKVHDLKLSRTAA